MQEQTYGGIDTLTANATGVGGEHGGSRVTDEKSVAQRVFDAQLESGSAEHAAYKALLLACDCDPEDIDSWPCQDCIYDHYDGSFEFKDTKVGWKPKWKHRRAWWKLGFLRCWIRYTDGTEKHYARIDA